MAAGEKESVTTHVCEVYIKAPPQTIWDAITTPEWTARYGYRGPASYDLRPGGAYKAHATPFMIQMGLPEVVVDGEVIEAVPPSKLVQTYRFKVSEQGAGGWSWILSDLKTLLETGSSMGD